MKIWTDLEPVLITAEKVTDNKLLCSLFTDCLDIDLYALPRPLDPDPLKDNSYKTWTSTVFVGILLGNPFIFEKPQLTAVQTGFRTVFISSDDLTPMTVAFSLSLYDTLKQPEDLISFDNHHLQFILAEHQQPHELATIIKLTFQARTRRYLSRPGHPNTDYIIGGVISQETADRDQNDHLLRVRSFVEAATGSSHLPLHDEYFKIKMYITYDDKKDNTKFPVMVFHTCGSTVDVTINRWLQGEMLKQKDDEIHVDDLFDSWFHCQVWNACLHFNVF